jgi:hypothetical protein
MKISDNQITELYRFTREHFVLHYDVQTELVDHLANDIEQIWVEQPMLTFREAKTISFKKFGVFGFMDVVEKRQKVLGNKYWRIIWRFAKDWFQLPKIALTFLICFLLYQIFTSNVSEYIFISIFFGYYLMCFVKIVQLKTTFKKRTKNTNKKWMLEDLIFKQGVGNAALLPLYTFQTFLHIDDLTNMSVILALIASVFYTSIFIIGYISLMIIPSKAEELLLETYPEYKIL